MCHNGACTCADGALCDGACRDLAIDADHCGACDNACPGAPHARGVCGAARCDLLCEPGWANCDGDADNGCETAGTCAPEELATVDYVATLATDGRSVYFATDLSYDAAADDALWRVPAVGGAPELLRRAKVADVAVAGPDIVWAEPGHPPVGYNPTDDGRILRMGKSDVAPVVLARDLQLPSRVAVSGEEVFFAEPSESWPCFGSSPGVLLSIDGAGLALRLRALVTVANARSLFVSATHIYWSDDEWPEPALFRASRSCADAVRIATPIIVALADGSGVWAITEPPNREQAVLVRLGSGGGAPRPLALQSLGAGASSDGVEYTWLAPHLAQDASSLYVFTRQQNLDAGTNSSRILRVAKANGATATLYDGPPVGAIAVAPDFVYLAAAAADGAHDVLERVPR